MYLGILLLGCVTGMTALSFWSGSGVVIVVIFGIELHLRICTRRLVCRILLGVVKMRSHVGVDDCAKAVNVIQKKKVLVGMENYGSPKSRDLFYGLGLGNL